MEDMQMLLDFSKVVLALLETHFVRVDGLECKSLFSEKKHIIAKGEKCCSNPVIKTACNNGTIAVVLPNGSVWIRASDEGASAAMRKVRNAAGTIPIVNGCHVPLSNQEEVSYHDLLRRFADSTWEPEYLMTQEAREAGFSQN